MKKKRKSRLTPEFWAKDAERMKLLEERIAFHDAKIAATRRASN